MCTKLFRIMPLIWLLGLAGGSLAAVLDDPTLVICYSLDDFGDTVTDESGRGNDGIVHGDVTPASDAGHRGARFEGTGGAAGFSYIDLDGANFPEEDIPRTGMTLAAWVKCENTGGHHAIFNARAADSTWLVHPELRSDGQFRWLLRSAGGSTLFDIRAPGVAWDEWLHYAGMYDQASGKAMFYLNGELAEEMNVSNAKEIAGDWGRGARLGINIDNARPFTGLMDAFHLFTRAISEQELAEVTQIPPQLKAYAPNPADGETYVLQPLLRWQPGDTAFFHQVYLGTRPELGPDDAVGPPCIPAMHWHQDGLTPGTTYYWRVDEIEADNVTVHEGDVWSFRAAPLTACDPEPWDGARWVDIEAELAWNPGSGATMHDVYFGTDEAAVAAGEESTLKASQNTMTYDPGALAKNTTYYWRIDEHVGDDVMYEGEIWSFTTMGPGAGVEAEYFRGTELEGNPVLAQIEDTIDHDWGAGEVAGGLSDDVSARWTANLEVPFTENVQLIVTHEDGVRLWLDGRLIINNWLDYRVTDDIAKVDLVAGQFYLLEMEWYETGGNAVARLAWQSPSIRRQIIPTGWLQLPVRSTSPYPAHTAVDVTQAPLLRWAAGGSAAEHDVYFGDDAEAVANATPADTGVYRGRQALDATSFDPGPLEWDKSYYWRVDEVNAASPDGPWQGCVWGFTTADFIIVDDFEGYTNDSPDRVFQAWVDGLGYSADDFFPDGHPGNRTGAAVGHDIWTPESPYFEGMIVEIEDVHGGYQAMPLYYDNTATPYRSEARRTWNTAQDWTLNGVDTVVLHIRGDAANVAAPLYVVIEDSMGRSGAVTHPNDVIVTTAEWTEWKTPMADFTGAGMDPHAVRKMTVGVGDLNAATPGGTGVVYVDDIWIAKSEEPNDVGP